jgi:ssDNA-binding Zn-finger/Zn-ribbon topoisomerase 1
MAIPKQILDHFPELLIINEALEQYERGEQVMARCPTCGSFLEVSKNDINKEIWVTCDKGCTHYRA